MGEVESAGDAARRKRREERRRAEANRDAEAQGEAEAGAELAESMRNGGSSSGGSSGSSSSSSSSGGGSYGGSSSQGEGQGHGPSEGLAALVAMGFAEGESAAALRRAQQNVEFAAQLLLEGPIAPEPLRLHAGTIDIDDDIGSRGTAGGGVMSYSAVAAQPHWVCKKCDTRNPVICDSCGSCNMPRI
jgi:hypothetical protein